MKVALLLSGQARTTKRSLEAFQKLVALHDPDVYIHTWKNPSNPNYCTSPRYTTDELCKIYEPGVTGIWLEDYDLVRPTLNPERFESNKASETKTHDTLSMWYSMSQVYKMMIENDIKYDLVIRCRFDIVSNWDIKLTEDLVIPYRDGTGHDAWGGRHYGGYADQLAYGAPGTLGVYCNLYHSADQLWKDGVRFHPETMLYEQLHRNGVPVQLSRDLTCEIDRNVEKVL